MSRGTVEIAWETGRKGETRISVYVPPECAGLPLHIRRRMAQEAKAALIRTHELEELLTPRRGTRPTGTRANEGIDPYETNGASSTPPRTESIIPDREG